MLHAIKKFFEENLLASAESKNTDVSRRLELATAALLFELMKTDEKIDERETAALAQVLKQTFDLDDGALQEVIALAEQQSRESTSLFEFTSAVNDSYTYEQRVQLLENMWRVAFADASLDRYEEHMIRRIADLIYVNHSDFIRTKLKVRDSSPTVNRV